MREQVLLNITPFHTQGILVSVGVLEPIHSKKRALEGQVPPPPQKVLQTPRSWAEKGSSAGVRALRLGARGKGPCWFPTSPHTEGSGSHCSGARGPGLERMLGPPALGGDPSSPTPPGLGAQPGRTRPCVSTVPVTPFPAGKQQAHPPLHKAWVLCTHCWPSDPGHL